MAIDVANSLQQLGLERYEPAFRDHEVDGDVLPDLTADDLIAIGVGAVGHRRKLLAAIAALRTGSISDTIPATAAPAAVSEKPSLAPEAERRQLTVMFVDLVDSTALAARLDPEEMAEVLRSYQSAVRGAIARFEGHVAKYMGDGVCWPILAIRALMKMKPNVRCGPASPRSRRCTAWDRHMARRWLPVSASRPVRWWSAS